MIKSALIILLLSILAPIFPENWAISSEIWTEISGNLESVSRTQRETPERLAAWLITLKTREQSYSSEIARLQESLQKLENQSQTETELLQRSEENSREQERRINSLQSYIAELKQKLHSLESIIELLKKQLTSLQRSRGLEKQIIQDIMRDQAIKNFQLQEQVRKQAGLIRTAWTVTGIVAVAGIILLVK